MHSIPFLEKKVVYRIQSFKFHLRLSDVNLPACDLKKMQARGRGLSLTFWACFTAVLQNCVFYNKGPSSVSTGRHTELSSQEEVSK